MAERGHGDDRGLDGVGAERGDAGGGLDGFEAAVRGLEDAFARMVRQHRQVITRQAAALKPGLSAGAMKAFITLCNAGTMTPSTLAEHLLLDRAQVSRMVRDLEDEGLITREPDPVDRRSALLTATEEGRARLDAVRGGPAGEGLRADLAHWDREDIRTLVRLLGRLVEERQARVDRTPDAG